jgi:hypothetical protein
MVDQKIQVRGKMRSDGVLELVEDDLIKAGWIQVDKYFENLNIVMEDRDRAWRQKIQELIKDIENADEIGGVMPWSPKFIRIWKVIKEQLEKLVSNQATHDSRKQEDEQKRGGQLSTDSPSPAEIKRSEIPTGKTKKSEDSR